VLPQESPLLPFIWLRCYGVNKKALRPGEAEGLWGIRRGYFRQAEGLFEAEQAVKRFGSHAVVEIQPPPAVVPL
jgi:hypothetical protein